MSGRPAWTEIDDLELGTRCVGALRAENITTINQLRAVKRDEFLRLPNVGIKSWMEIVDVIANLDAQPNRIREAQLEQEFIAWCLLHRVKLEMLRRGEAKVLLDF